LCRHDGGYQLEIRYQRAARQHGMVLAESGVERESLFHQPRRVAEGGDKAVFCVGYDGSNRSDPRGAVTTGVPTPGQTSGDLSGLLKLGANYQIYDPATIAPAANGRFSRQAFSGNIIPPSRIDPLALRLAAFWLPPNLPGTADGTNNWTTPGPEFIKNRSY